MVDSGIRRDSLRFGGTWVTPESMDRTRTLLLALTLLLPASASFAQLVFTEVAADVGVRVLHDPLGLYPDGVQQQNFYGSGVAWADINADGWLDLLFVNGEAGSSTFLNNGDGTFDPLPNFMNRRRVAAGTGIAVADIDNDGDLDFACTNYYGEPFLYVGSGNGTAEQGENLGVNPLLFGPTDTPPDNWIGPQSMGVAFGDIDQDGFLDAYVANYQAQVDMLLHSVQGGYFEHTDWVHSVQAAQGFQPVFWDFDNDNDLDIYVANDFGRNYLFENGGASNGFALTEVAQQYKIAGGNGWPSPASLSMGLAVGDYDNDLDLDLYVTNYFENALYENVGSVSDLWRFRERGLEAKVRYMLNSWGTEFADVDLDGDLDLVLTGGWIPSDPNLDQGRNIDDRLFLNDGAPNWTFTDATEASGFGTDQQSGRGLAVADFDRDGDLDVAVSYNSQYDPIPAPGAVFYEGWSALYRNDQTGGRHWLALELIGSVSCNRSAVGSRVTVTTPAGAQMREIRAGGSFLSQSSLEAGFGLGSETTITEVRVRWLGGSEEVFSGVVADGVFRLREGSGVAEAAMPLPTGLSAEWTGEGMQLAWHHAPWLRPDGAVVERASAGSSEFTPVAAPARLPSDRTGSLLDDTAAEETTYVYRVALSSPFGQGQSIALEATTGIYDETPSPVDRARLGQNYPNPFNPGTTIRYDLPRAMQVRLSIYDLRGRHLATLVDGWREAGAEVSWDGKDDAGNTLASGTYIYTLHTPEGSQSRRLTLLR